MNENAKKWVAALRSGEFTQATGALRVGDSYCCLGVACELYRRENGGEWGKFICGRQYFLGSEMMLPREVQDWIGLRSYKGSYTHSNCLSEKNDQGASFAEIADIIESEPEGLFR